MKKFVSLMILTVVTMALAVACAEKGDNRGGNPFFDVPGNNPFNQFGIVYGKSFGGSLAVANSHNYREYLDDLLGCNVEFGLPQLGWSWGNINQCKQIDSNPRVAINFDDDGAGRVRTNGFGEIEGQFTITIGNNYGPVFSEPMYMRFTPIEGGKQYQARTLGRAGTATFNGEMVITVVGDPNGSTISMELVYRNRMIGSSVLTALPTGSGYYGNGFNNDPYRFGTGYNRNNLYQPRSGFRSY